MSSEFSRLVTDYHVVFDKYFKKDRRILKYGNDEIRWNIYGSTYFSAMTYSTLGFGHLFPVTRTGRMFTLFYALLGIPIFYALLFPVGQLITYCAKKIWAYITRTSYLDDDELVLPIYVALGIELLYVLLGSFVFKFGEGWSYFESVYFVMISMMSIAFGDYIPSVYWVIRFTMAYFLIGLCLTMMSYTVIKERLQAWSTSAQAKLEHRLREGRLSTVPTLVK